ncbi:hypothetical protein [Burkholderia cenocepacia]|uniref:hypothetical protein n=1 Tax=Burkholderia cenocepacia TaxID=95486 RepID=UPI002B24C5F7|nr:hypothetical protein [Burkholderia cenocepacia]MEB2554070.1 hypothetical protein [Burkholderia cenocepacia]
MNLREITQYLQNSPHGATCLRIAKDLDCDPQELEVGMISLYRQHRVYPLQRGKLVIDSVWAVQRKPHIPVFRANEILEAFQAAAMAKLLEANGVMA